MCWLLALSAFRAPQDGLDLVFNRMQHGTDVPCRYVEARDVLRVYSAADLKWVTF